MKTAAKTFLYRPAFILVLLLLFTLSCEKGGSAGFSSEVQRHKKAQLDNIYDNEISRLNTEFITETSLLNDGISHFKQETTTANLIEVQQQWLRTLKVWKQMELYNIGDISKTFIHSEIGRWPSNEVFINDFIDEIEIIDEAFIASKGASSKGISALEYLLFSAEDNDIVLTSFSSDANYAKRLDYLTAVAQNLKTKANELSELWTAYRAKFTSGLENGVEGSQNQIINQMVSTIEAILISKLGKPLGDTNGGTIALDELEAARSGASLEIIQQHLISLKRCYKGDFALTPFRVGFDDFLILIGSEDFSDKITAQFSECQKKIDAIKGSLHDEISSNPEAVVALKNSFTDLLVLIKVDMANVLGSTITFNDNDGD